MQLQGSQLVHMAARGVRWHTIQCTSRGAQIGSALLTRARLDGCFLRACPERAVLEQDAPLCLGTCAELMRPPQARSLRRAMHAAPSRDSSGLTAADLQVPRAPPLPWRAMHRASSLLLWLVPLILAAVATQRRRRRDGRK